MRVNRIAGRWFATVVWVAVYWAAWDSCAFAMGQDYANKSDHKSDIVKKAERIDDDAKAKKELEELQAAELEARQRELERSTQEDKAAGIRD